MSTLYNTLSYSKNPTNVIQYSTPYNLRNCSPCVIRLQNGNLLCTWSHFGITSEDLTPGEVWAKKSTNNGKSWSDAYLIIPIPIGVVSAVIPSTYQKTNGDIILVCWQQYDATPDYTEIWKYTSTDNGVTFEGGTQIYASNDYGVSGDYYTFNGQRIFKTQTGRLLFSFDVETNPVAFSGTANTICRVLISDDEGDTWSVSATNMMAAASGIEALLAESVICQVPNGTLLCASRTRSGHVRISTSTNNGTTWSNPPTKSATLEASNATVWMSYTNGKLIALLNRPEGGIVDGSAARVHLDLWKSEDLGSTWSLVKNIAYDGSINIFCEPVVFDTGYSILVFHTKYDYANALVSIILQNLVFDEVLYNEF
jgi:hypothetical protein